MDRDGVRAWVAEYERAWRDGDVDAVGRLFTDDVRYLVSPYAAPKTLDDVRAFWADDVGCRFTVTAEPVAVQGDDAVVRLEVRYEDPQPQEYRDLWVLRFAGDGRVQHFEEWAFWPDKPWTAAGELS